MHPKLLSFWAFYPPDVLPLLVAQRINVFFGGGGYRSDRVCTVLWLRNTSDQYLIFVSQVL